MSVAQGADIQSRLTIVCQDLVAFFTEAGIEKHSIAFLTTKMESQHNLDFLNACAAYGKSMAFIDHDILHKGLATGWSLLDDKARNDRNIIVKKINILLNDKSEEAPAKIVTLKQQFEDLDKRRANSLLETLKYRYMVSVPMEVFKTDNGKTELKKIFDENRDVTFAACKFAGKTKH